MSTAADGRQAPLQRNVATPLLPLQTLMTRARSAIHGPEENGVLNEKGAGRANARPPREMRRARGVERQTGFRRRVWERGDEGPPLCAQALVDGSSFRYRTPLGDLVTYGPGNTGRRRRVHSYEGEGKTERPECGGARARHGLKRRQRSSRRRGWTVFRIPTGWTVFEIASAPWVHTVRPIGLVRSRFSA